jgi:hypothetical protein
VNYNPLPPSPLLLPPSLPPPFALTLPLSSLFPPSPPPSPGPPSSDEAGSQQRLILSYEKFNGYTGALLIN